MFPNNWDIPHLEWSTEKVLQEQEKWKTSLLNFILYFAPPAWREYDYSKDHLEVIADLDEIARDYNRGKSRKYLFSVFRGFGKSTLIKLFVCQQLLYGKYDFIVYVGNDPDVVREKVQDIRNFLLFNPRLVGRPGADGIFTPDEVLGLASKANSGVKSTESLLTTGAGKSLMYIPLAMDSGRFTDKAMGLTVGGYRLQLILFDDPQHPKFNAPEDLKKLKNWYYSVIEPAADRVCSQIMTATLCRGSCWAADILKMGEFWDSHYIPSCFDENERSIWEAKFDTNWLLKKREEYRRDGAYSDWLEQFENNPATSEESIFQPEYIKYHDATALLTQNGILQLQCQRYNHKQDPLGNVINRTIVPIVIIDPAGGGESTDTDFFAAIVLGMDERGEYYLLDMYQQRCADWEKSIDEIYEMAGRWGCKHIWIEDVNMQKGLMGWMKERKGKFDQDILIRMHKSRKEKGAKDVRIAALQPYMKAGRLFYPLSRQHKYEAIKDDKGTIIEESKTIDLTEILVSNTLSFQFGMKRSHTKDMLDCLGMGLEILKPPSIADIPADDPDLWWKQRVYTLEALQKLYGQKRISPYALPKDNPIRVF